MNLSTVPIRKMGLIAAGFTAETDLLAAVSYAKRMTATLYSSEEHWRAYSVPVCSLCFGIFRDSISE